MNPSLETLKELSKNNEYKVAPVGIEMFSDIATPIQVLKILKNHSNHCYILESISDSEKWGRYTFLGFDPKLEITCQNGKAFIPFLTCGDPNLETTAKIVSLVKQNTTTPCAVGFGISTPEQAAEMAKFSDGVIVGSAIVKIIAEYGENSVEYVSEYVKSMKDLIRNL